MVFTGAGASFAVSQEKYPTTIQYFNRLDLTIRNNKLFRSTVKNVEDSGESLDIENVLFRLKWILDKMKISNEISNPYYKYFQGVLNENNLMPQCEQLYNKINSRVYTFYSQKPTNAELKNNWQLLIELLKKSNEVINIFTTNYDTVIETALARFNKSKGFDISDGFIQEETGESSFSINEWSQNRFENGLLTKLHGSINWGGVGNNIYKRPANVPDKNGNNPLIYPGFKGTPNSSPYKNFHDYFKSCLPRIKHLIVIGFAFRDEFINTCFTKINSSCMVTNIGFGKEPNTVPQFLTSRNYQYIDSGFDKNAVELLKERMSIK